MEPWPGPNQHPNQHDYDELVTIYSHLDSTTAVGAAVPSRASEAVVGDDASSWGRIVEGSRAAKHSKYVRDLGWAPTPPGGHESGSDLREQVRPPIGRADRI